MPNQADIAIAVVPVAHKRVLDIEKKVLTLVRQGRRFVVFDLGDVKALLGVEIESLLWSMDHCRDAGGALVCSDLKAGIVTVLRIMGIEGRFRIYEGAEKAVAGLREAYPAAAALSVERVDLDGVTPSEEEPAGDRAPGAAVEAADVDGDVVDLDESAVVVSSLEASADGDAVIVSTEDLLDLPGAALAAAQAREAPDEGPDGGEDDLAREASEVFFVRDLVRPEEQEIVDLGEESIVGRPSQPGASLARDVPPAATAAPTTVSAAEVASAPRPTPIPPAFGAANAPTTMAQLDEIESTSVIVSKIRLEEPAVVAGPRGVASSEAPGAIPIPDAGPDEEEETAPLATASETGNAPDGVEAEPGTVSARDIERQLLESSDMVFAGKPAGAATGPGRRASSPEVEYRRPVSSPRRPGARRALVAGVLLAFLLVGGGGVGLRVANPELWNATVGSVLPGAMAGSSGDPGGPSVTPPGPGSGPVEGPHVVPPQPEDPARSRERFERTLQEALRAALAPGSGEGG
ncbi:MAG: hypothetical protein HY722_02400 [Planctomycetes bacterium]|nr:hypothetical protein [Planctomycetota bacterium]